MTNRIRLHRPKQNRRGALTVEMAIVLPLFFLFLFASIEFSRMNMIRHTAENAAYEAARSAIVPGGSAARARQVGLNIMSSVGCRNMTVTTVPAVIQNSTPEVEVFVSVPCDDNAYFAPNFFGGRNITGRSKLTRERL